MRNQIFTAVLVALTFAGTANAETADATVRYSKAFTTCMDGSGGVTFDMVECMNAELTRQDAKLNAEYKVLMKSLSTERKTQLRNAQRAWITYRDENCAFYYDPDGGTMARLEANMCMLRMTAERANELEVFNQHS